MTTPSPSTDKLKQSLLLVSGLLLVYLLAWLFPQPAIALRSVDLADFGGGMRVSLSLIILALLMFVGGLSAHAKRPGERRKLLGNVAVATLAAWSIPLLAMCAVTWLAKIAITNWLPATSDQTGQLLLQMLLGLMVVVAMPTATSSIGWVQVAGGNMRLSLGTVLAGTLTIPLAAPIVFHISGTSVTGSFVAITAWLAAWMIVPATGGYLAPCMFPVLLHIKWRQRAQHVSLMALLLLNYINAAASLSELTGATWLFLTAGLLVAVYSLFCFLQTLLFTHFLRLHRAERTSLLFAVMMKNTGASLVLAGASLTGQPAAILPILILTLAQHLLASWITGSVLVDEHRPDRRWQHSSGILRLFLQRRLDHPY